MPERDPSRVVLITGCSSGFGLHAAAHLASKGHRVVATMRDLDKKGPLLSEVHRRGGKVDLLRLDVTDKATIRNAVRQIAAEYGYIDVLVNNAGMGMGGFFEDLAEEDIREIMEVNFFGVQAVTREVIPLMRSRKQGRIINVSSVSGFSASPAFGAYNASKWALEAFSESLRYELKFFGIDVVLIEPGTYVTKIFSDNVRYAKNFNNPQSPYYFISQFLKKKIEDYVADCHKDIEKIPALIEKLILANDPSFRNIPDIEGKALYFLRRLLPFSLYSFLIRRALFSGMCHPTAK